MEFIKILKTLLKSVISLTIILALLSCIDINSKNMGLFNRLFKKTEKEIEAPQDTIKIEETSEMLNEDLFWEIIDRSIKETKTQDQQEKHLIAQIEKLTLKEIIGFRLRTDFLLYQTYNSELWCAGYIMNGGCSDDSFEYFRNWIISRGRDTFYKAKNNPDTLISEVVDGMESYDFESFWYVALEAFKNRTGKELYDFIDYENFNTKEGNYPQFEFSWQEDDPESMKKICPQLFQKFNN